MYHRIKMPSKPTVFVMLMAASLVLMMIPVDVLRPARNMTQLIALPQWAVQRATDTATKPIETLSRETLTPAQQNQILRENQSLENENLVLRQQIETLRSTIEELSLLRQQGVPENVSLIPASVIASDADPRRDSLLLGKGNRKGINEDEWVASRLFVQIGDQAGVRRDSAVLARDMMLARENLIGWVEETTASTSRVVLLSDAYANRPIRVHLAHFDPESKRPLLVTIEDKVAPFVLRGMGGGKMIVADIDRAFIDAGVVAVGDLVTSDPNDPNLPHAMVVGEIVEIHHNKDKPLFYDAIVRHRYDPKSLSQVMIVDLKPSS